MTNNTSDQSDQWLRAEVEDKRDDLVAEFEQGRPKLTMIDGNLGIWVQINTQDDHDPLLDAVDDITRYLYTRGYNARAVYDKPYDPDTGDAHYEGHIYALPAEVDDPPYPEDKMPQVRDAKKFELLAD